MSTNGDSINREARRWGPFSGRHLTIMFVALVVGLVAVPATAWTAVQFTNVAITDPGGVHRAKVDAGGSLRTKVTGQVANADIDSPGRSVFNATLFVHFNDQSPYGSIGTVSVPAGKRFVIRDVNIHATLPAGQRLPWASLNVSVATEHTFSHLFGLAFTGNDGIEDVSVSQNATMIYAAGGTTITAIAIRNASAGTGSAVFVLSGDLIDCSTATGCTAAEALG